MDSQFIWIFLAFGMLEVFFVTTITEFTKKEGTEVILSTPLIALIQLPITAAILMGLAEIMLPKLEKKKSLHFSTSLLRLSIPL